MTTPHKIRAETTTKRNSKQSPRRSPREQTRAEQAAFVAPNGNDRPFDESFDHPSCLCIYDRVGRGIVSEVIGEDEFFSLKSAHLGRGEFEQVIAEAVREKIRASGQSIHRVGNTEHTVVCLSTVVSTEENELVQDALRKRNQNSERRQDLPAFLRSVILGAARNILTPELQSRGSDAQEVLVRFALKYAHCAPEDTQIEVCHAAAELTQSDRLGLCARDLAVAVSRAAAVRLDVAHHANR